jgi:hypothetical protein
MTVAAHLRPHLMPRESAAYLGPRCLAVVLTFADRGRELDSLLRKLPGLRQVESATRPRPDGNPEQWAHWLVDVFPELIDDPLP